MIIMNAYMCYVFRRMINGLLSRMIMEGSWRRLDLNLILQNEGSEATDINKSESEFKTMELRVIFI